MARGEQPRVEAVPERHNGVELSTIILSLGSGLYLPSSSPDARTHPNGSLQALHCCVLPFPSFFPSFQLWKGKWFSRRSLERFLRCWRKISSKFFFFFIYRWELDRVCDSFYFYFFCSNLLNYSTLVQKNLYLLLFLNLLEIEIWRVLSYQLTQNWNNQFMVSWKIF